jgi:hypothetical protein
MPHRYTAKLYFNEKEINHESGDDVDALYTWLLTKAEGKFGNTSGEIIDNKTREVVKTFKKSPSE